MKFINLFFHSLAIFVLPCVCIAEGIDLAGTDLAPPETNGSCQLLELPNCFPSNPHEKQLLFAFERADEPTYSGSANYLVCDSKYDKAIDDLNLGKNFDSVSFRFHSEFLCVKDPGSATPEWVMQKYNAYFDRDSRSYEKINNSKGGSDIVTEHQTIDESAVFSYKKLVTLDSVLSLDQWSRTFKSANFITYSYFDSKDSGICDHATLNSRNVKLFDTLVLSPKAQLRIESEKLACNRKVIKGHYIQEAAGYEDSMSNQLLYHQVSVSEQTQDRSGSYHRSLTYNPQNAGFSHLEIEHFGKFVIPMLKLDWGLNGALTLAEYGKSYALPLQITDQDDILSQIEDGARIEESIGLEFGPSVSVVTRRFLER